MLAMLSAGCRDEPTATQDPPIPEPPTDPARSGKVDPAPHSKLALGRAVFEALQQDDWDGYTNTLAARADMMAVFQDTDQGDRRERRRRRRIVWRRINRLRGGGAEAGWKKTRRAAKQAGVAWDTARLLDVRHGPSTPELLPSEVTAAELRLVIEHRGVQLGIDLGPCVRTPRGWVVLYPMKWQGEGHGEPFGESLMGAVPDP
ncbi:MAG: hypothetical protein AAGF11_48280 [Myxococcota bacterium]